MPSAFAPSRWPAWACRSRRSPPTTGCVAADPHLAEMWSQRGSLLREMGRLEEAKASYARRGHGATTRRSTTTTSPASPAARRLLPRRPSYVERLFDDYSDEFDAHLARRPRLSRAHPARREPARAGTTLRLGARPRLRHRPLRAPARAAIGAPDRHRSRRRHARAGAGARRLRPAERRPRWWHGLEANAETFDLIVSVDVLIYIGDLEGLFAGARRALASGGAVRLQHRAARRAATTAPPLRPAAEPSLHPLRPLHPRARRTPWLRRRPRRCRRRCARTGTKRSRASTST